MSVRNFEARIRKLEGQDAAAIPPTPPEYDYAADQRFSLLDEIMELERQGGKVPEAKRKAFEEADTTFWKHHRRFTAWASKARIVEKSGTLFFEAVNDHPNRATHDRLNGAIKKWRKRVSGRLSNQPISPPF